MRRTTTLLHREPRLITTLAQLRQASTHPLEPFQVARIHLPRPIHRTASVSAASTCPPRPTSTNASIARTSSAPQSSNTLRISKSAAKDTIPQRRQYYSLQIPHCDNKKPVKHPFCKQEVDQQTLLKDKSIHTSTCTSLCNSIRNPLAL